MCIRDSIGIPPKYSYKISFQGKDCMVIPLEGIDKSKAKKGNKTKTEKGDR